VKIHSSWRSHLAFSRLELEISQNSQPCGEVEFHFVWFNLEVVHRLWILELSKWILWYMTVFPDSRKNSRRPPMTLGRNCKCSPAKHPRTCRLKSPPFCMGSSQT
jgi:hypothetical protein